MEKTSYQAWAEFKKSATYSTMVDSLARLFFIAGVSDALSIADLTVKTAFIQGYIYRNL